MAGDREQLAEDHGSTGCSHGSSRVRGKRDLSCCIESSAPALVERTDAAAEQGGDQTSDRLRIRAAHQQAGCLVGSRS
jgi:hypothetical protein